MKTATPFYLLGTADPVVPPCACGPLSNGPPVIPGIDGRVELTGCFQMTFMLDSLPRYLGQLMAPRLTKRQLEHFLAVAADRGINRSSLSHLAMFACVQPLPSYRRGAS